MAFFKVHFYNASASLRHDKDFMLRIVKIKPILILSAGEQLKYDFDLLVVVISERGVGEKVFFEYYRRSAGEFYDQANEKLAAHDTFCSIVLPAISFTSV